jgi:transcriptional regulator with GAF, ATPase, and Fis domain/tetratricopeptide (TPR) repeat protein
MASSPLKTGDVINQRYRVESLLGQGGLGTVYRCRDLRNETPVALKLLRSPISGEGKSPLHSEFSILSRLRHPNLVRILDFGKLGGLRGPFIVQEYVEGRNLFEATAGWPIGQVLEVLAGLCRVVQYLHDRGVVHRDLKPGNVLFASSPDGCGQLKVLDFGLAQWLTDERGQKVGGTLAYMAPEVLMGRGAGPRSDLYSLGILFYQVLTRRLPFEDKDTGYLVQKHLQGHADLGPVERLQHGSGLARVIAGLLEKDPERRPPSAMEALRLLEAASGLDLNPRGVLGRDLYFSSASFVGRESEMALLQQRAQRVRETGRGWTVFITGESGSGKSRCMEELRIWAQLEGWRVAEGSCTPTERRLYGPYRDLLNEIRRPLAAEARRSPEFPPPSLPAAGGRSPFGDLVGESTAVQFRDQLAREIVEQLRWEPTLVLLHDFHWADEATAAVLDYLTSDILPHPIFLCVSAREAEAEQPTVGRLMSQSARQLRGEKLVLGPLAKDAVIRLISNMTGEKELASWLGEWVGRTIGGNPFFVEETLKHLADRGILRRDAGRWRAETVDLNELKPPDTVAAVLRRRLSHLSMEEGEVAHWLAVINRPASDELLAAVVPGGHDSLDSALRGLVDRQIARTFDGPEKQTYGFYHASIAEVVSEDLPPDKKSAMHRAIGEALEQQGQGVRVVEIASHFTAGDAGDKALDYAFKAAETCKVESANEMLLRFSNFILEKGRHYPTERLGEVAIDAAEACCTLGVPEDGVRILEERLNASQKGSNIVLARLLMQLAYCYQHLGQLELLEDACRRSLAFLDEDESEIGDITRAIAYKHLAYSLTVRNCQTQSLEVLEKALEALRPHGLVATSLGGRIYIIIAVANYWKGNHRASVAAARRAVEMLQNTKSSALLSQAHSNMSIGLIALGKHGLARSQGEIAASIADQCRSIMTRFAATANLVESTCRFGLVREAIVHARRRMELMAEVQNPVPFHEGSAVISEARVTFGDYAAAREMLGVLNVDAHANLAVHARSQIRYVAAWMSYLLGDHASALRDVEALKELHINNGPIFEYELGEAIRAAIHRSDRRKTQSKELLLELDRNLRRKGSPFPTCIVNLLLAETLLEDGELENARRCIRWALNLSRAMPSLHLNAQALLLRARWWRLMAERSFAANDAQDRLSNLQQARVDVGASLKLAEEAGVDDMIWPVYAEWARIEEPLSEWQAAADCSRKALKHLEKAQEKVPRQDVEGFLSALGRGKTRSECESRLSRIHSMETREGPRPGVLDEAHSRILAQVTRVIGNISDRDALLESLVDLMVQAVGMERALVFLREEGMDRLRLAKGRNALHETVKRAEAISRSVLNDVYRQGEPFVTANASVDPRVSMRDSVMAFEIGTIFCGPLRVNGRTLGVVYADHRSPLSEISESMINLFAACCQLSATAIAGTKSGTPAAEPRESQEASAHAAPESYPEIVGRSQAVHVLRDRIASVAASPLDVLVCGESGTGKELVARALHSTNARAKGRFVAVDCGSLADGLVESEFFGYKKGAFTGAAENRAGLLESAAGGTLFLDEISNMPLRLQAKLLRVLQEREVRRVGDSAARKIDIRVIAATNRDLRQDVERGRFRGDLYYRLNAMEIRVPPLRERLEDVPLLLSWFLNQTAEKAGAPTKSFSPQALDLLKRYSYPGNVRELINAVGRGFYTSQGPVIEVEHLPPEMRQPSGAGESSALIEGRAREIYISIRAGRGTFEDLVRAPFKGRKLSPEVVAGVVCLALADTRGRYRDALALLGVGEADYHITMSFLKRHGCCPDFRRFRSAPFPSRKD